MSKAHEVKLNKDLTLFHGNSKELGFFVRVTDQRIDDGKVVVDWSDKNGFTTNVLNITLAHISDSTTLIAAANTNFMKGI